MTDNKKKKKKRPMIRFKKGEELFFTAFLKKDKDTFYVCRGRVLQCPAQNERQLYKVRIIAVADRAVGGKPGVVKQGTLLGLTITKRPRELQRDIPAFMVPPEWIELEADETTNRHLQPNRDGEGHVPVQGKRQKAKENLRSGGPGSSAPKKK